MLGELVASQPAQASPLRLLVMWQVQISLRLSSHRLASCSLGRGFLCLWLFDRQNERLGFISWSRRWGGRHWRCRLRANDTDVQEMSRHSSTFAHRASANSTRSHAPLDWSGRRDAGAFAVAAAPSCRSTGGAATATATS